MSDTPQNTNTSPLRPVLTTLAILIFVAGIGMGVYALFASLGVWMGMWDFRRGFDMLRGVNASADWLAWIGLVITLAVFFAAKPLALHNARRLSTLPPLVPLPPRWPIWFPRLTVQQKELRRSMTSPPTPTILPSTSPLPRSEPMRQTT